MQLGTEEIMFCGDHLLCARLRRAIDASAGTVDELQRIVAHLRQWWPVVEMLVRADSGFCREEIHGLVREQRRGPRLRPRTQLSA